MPYYQYQCEDCGEVFEKKLRFSEADDPQDCPTCQSKETRKLVTSFATGGFSTSFSPSGNSCGSGGGHFT